MKQLQLDTRTYFDVGNAVNPNCLKVMPLEPKKRLQKCNREYLLFKYSCRGESLKSSVLGMQKGRDDARH
jgi:hypothetical protein